MKSIWEFLLYLFLVLLAIRIVWIAPRFIISRVIVYWNCRTLRHGIFIPLYPGCVFLPSFGRPNFVIYCDRKVYLYNLNAFDKSTTLFLSTDRRWKLGNTFVSKFAKDKFSLSIKAPFKTHDSSVYLNRELWTEPYVEEVIPIFMPAPRCKDVSTVVVRKGIDKEATKRLTLAEKRALAEGNLAEVGIVNQQETVVTQLYSGDYFMDFLIADPGMIKTLDRNRTDVTMTAEEKKAIKKKIKKLLRSAAV